METSAIHLSLSRSRSRSYQRIFRTLIIASNRTYHAVCKTWNAKINIKPIFNGQLVLKQALRPHQLAQVPPPRLHTTRSNENEIHDAPGLSKEEFLELARNLNIRGPKTATLAATLAGPDGRSGQYSPTVQFDPCLQRLSQNSFLLSWLSQESYGSYSSISENLGMEIVTISEKGVERKKINFGALENRFPVAISRDTFVLLHWDPFWRQRQSNIADFPVLKLNPAGAASLLRLADVFPSLQNRPESETTLGGENLLSTNIVPNQDPTKPSILFNLHTMEGRLHDVYLVTPDAPIRHLCLPGLNAFFMTGNTIFLQNKSQIRVYNIASDKPTLLAEHATDPDLNFVCAASSVDDPSEVVLKFSDLLYSKAEKPRRIMVVSARDGSLLQDVQLPGYSWLYPNDIVGSNLLSMNKHMIAVASFKNSTVLISRYDGSVIGQFGYVPHDRSYVGPGNVNFIGDTKLLIGISTKTVVVDLNNDHVDGSSVIGLLCDPSSSQSVETCNLPLRGIQAQIRSLVSAIQAPPASRTVKLQDDVRCTIWYDEMNKTGRENYILDDILGGGDPQSIHAGFAWSKQAHSLEYPSISISETWKARRSRSRGLFGRPPASVERIFGTGLLVFERFNPSIGVWEYIDANWNLIKPPSAV